MPEQLNAEAIRVAKDRYFTQEERDILETLGSEFAFKHMCQRVSTAVAVAEKKEDVQEWEQKFFQALTNQTFVPGGRFWSNAGTGNQQLFNCDVLSPKDDLHHIYDTLHNWGIAHSNGAGVGGFFGHLRHRGASVAKEGKIAGGPCKVILMYDAEADFSHSTGSRRAACMGNLQITHPDILEFILMKGRGNITLKRFNLSPHIPEAFIEETTPFKVTTFTGESFYLWVPWKEKGNRLLSLKTNYLLRRLVSDSHYSDEGFVVTREDLWDLIARKAWECGDPGLIFIDTINKRNPLISSFLDTSNRWYIWATNPCAEIPQADGEICMLASINLSKMVVKKQILWNEIFEAVTLGIRFLDNGIDVSTYPLSENEYAAKQTRRVGLGFMGLADLLIQLEVSYGSSESLQIAEDIMGFMNKTALEASVALGKERGNFPLFEQSAYATGANGFEKVSSLRNAYRTTLAPTGTTSILAMTSSSSEPLYELEYERKDETGERVVRSPLWQAWIDKNRNKERPAWFCTALDIPWKDHIQMQAVLQKHVDNSISKTINMPQHATVADVRNAYMMAHKLGCKGITIYRDKSKEVQVLNAIPKDQPQELSPSLIVTKRGLKRERSEGTLSGETTKVKTGDGSLFVTVNVNGDDKPFEVFASIAKAGSDTLAFTEAIGRLISIALQYKVPVEEVAKQLTGISGAKPIFHQIGKHRKILSVPDAIGKVLELYENTTPVLESVTASQILSSGVILAPYSVGTKVLDLCTICNQEFRYVEGCRTCGCGSKCD